MGESIPVDSYQSVLFQGIHPYRFATIDEVRVEDVSYIRVSQITGFYPSGQLPGLSGWNFYRCLVPAWMAAPVTVE